jgi:hypothetical protein
MGMNPRLLRPTPTGFDPRRIAGLVAWLDSADNSTITTSTGVSEWRSKVGNVVLAQSTGANQPTLSNINGRQAFDYNGTTQGLFVNSTSITQNVSGITQFVVFQTDDASTQNFRSLVDCNTGPFFDRCTLYPRQSSFEAGGRRLDGNSFQSVQNGAVANATTYLGGSVFDYANAALASYLNGVGVARGGGFQDAGNTSNTAGSFSVGANVSSPNNIGNFFDGRIGEVLIYNRALSAEERQSVERWLAGRFGVAL